MRGKAVTTIFTVFQLAAENVHKIIAFFEQTKVEDGRFEPLQEKPKKRASRRRPRFRQRVAHDSPASADDRATSSPPDNRRKRAPSGRPPVSKT